MKIILKKTLLAANFIFLAACSNITNANYNSDHKKTKINIVKKDHLNQLEKQKILHQYSKWEGVRYKFGGTTKKGVDCSAFIGHVYKDAFNLQLPRTTSQLKTKGKYIPKSQLKNGDMVFFRGNKHVGIYIGNNQFIHASSKKGVITSRLDSGYYAKAYTQARRIL